MRMNLYMRRAVAGIFVFLYLFSYINSTVFSHTHYSPDGVATTHSHPFRSASHTHSVADFRILQSGAFVAALPAVFILTAAFALIARIGGEYVPVLTGFCKSASYLRGPPSFI